MARTAKKETALTAEEKLAQALVPEEEQPYPVPENWCWVHLSGLLREIKNGTTIKQDKSGEGYSVTRIESLQNQTIDFNRLGTIIDKSEIKETDWYIAGDIALSHINSADHVGKTALISEAMLPLVHGMNLLRLRFTEALSPLLFQYYSQSFQYKDAILARINMAVNQVSINQKQIGTIEFPLPPLAEQQRIVDRIESLFAKLDEAKEKAQAVVDGFEDRKAAILHKAFTGELTEQWRIENKRTKVKWVHKKFSEICDIVRGGSPRPAGDPKYYDGNIPFMKVADITNNSGPYVTSATYSIKEAGLKKTRMIEPNTLLLTNSGATLGVPAICTFQTTFNDGIAAFLNLNPESLLFFYYFWSSKTPELRSINMGAAQPNLNTSIIGAVEIDIPTIEEQKEIVRILETVLKKEEQVKETAEQVIDQIITIKKGILARAFRGELGTNDSTDESAEELLKRIL